MKVHKCGVTLNPAQPLTNNTPEGVYRAEAYDYIYAIVLVLGGIQTIFSFDSHANTIAPFSLHEWGNYRFRKVNKGVCFELRDPA